MIGERIAAVLGGIASVVAVARADAPPPAGTTVALTVPSGRSIADVADLLVTAGLAPSRDAALAAARDPALIARLKLPAGAPSVEGYLYPDTYHVRTGTPVADIYAVMVERQRVQYAALATKHARSLRDLERALHAGDREIVILASIVEKETVHPSDMPKVAGVYVARLRAKGRLRRLEADSTVRYGCVVAQVASEACRALAPGDRLHAAQLRDPDNPYDSYTHDGLPPGPIASPGADALAAAMSPDTSDGDRYFLIESDGTAVFSRTAEQHQGAVEKYLRGP